MGFDQHSLLDTAREYCRLIESARPDDDDWLVALARVLSRLHALVAALEMPPVGICAPAELDLDSRFDLFSRLHAALGERDSYWLEYDAPREQPAVTGSLADDLTDIYCDLRLGLNRLAAEQDPGRVLQEWRHGFSIHWGQHLVDATRHLYTLNSPRLPV
jgi:hypothetical protein